jgi:hypothetical protein
MENRTEFTKEEANMVKLLRWVLKHYETHTDENFMFGWINPNGKEFNSIEIVEQYLKENK